MEPQDSTTFIDQLERTPDPRRARGRSFEWRVLLERVLEVLLHFHRYTAGLRASRPSMSCTMAA